MVKKRNTKKRQELIKNLKYEFIGIVLWTLMLIELFELGIVGSTLNTLFRYFFGQWDYLISIGIILFALYLMFARNFTFKITPQKIGVIFMVSAIALFNHINFVEYLNANNLLTDTGVWQVTWSSLNADRLVPGSSEIGGGLLGAALYIAFFFLFNDLGAKIIVVTLALIGVLLFFSLSYIDLFKKLVNKIKTSYKNFKKQQEANKKLDKKPDKKHPAPIIHDFVNNETVATTSVNPKEQQPDYIDKTEIEAGTSVTNNANVKGNANLLTPTSDLTNNYELPSTKLLEQYKSVQVTDNFEYISDNARKLEEALASFGVGIKVVQIHKGPAVTRYEVHPDFGVKVSRIVNLVDDIALALAAKDIRIEAPIPGKSAIGIEVPNADVSIVSLKEVIASPKFNSSKSKLSLALGIDVTGEPIVQDLLQMPHLLVAGTTGSGKSVSLNTMIISILYKASPQEVKFIMIDTKVVELNIYNGLPHLLAPVITDPKKASQSLKMIVEEMENRYELFSLKGVRDIEKYNEIMEAEGKKAGTQWSLMPYIVIVIDELADLMMAASNDVEESIIRIAQKARAAGIHLIVATQRPTVDVITGLIKANIPSRIAFEVSSQVDSRTILDLNGAEKLLGKGDMLLMPVGASKPLRVQGAYISVNEVEQVVDFIKKQQDVSYEVDIVESFTAHEEATESSDELYDEAVELIIEANQASVSFLQRRLRIGYNRAARLIDEMEAKGVIGPYEGTKPRKVILNNKGNNS